MRGFLVRAALNDRVEHNDPVIRITRVPIVGVVVRTRIIDLPGHSSAIHPEILPVIHTPNWASDATGGMEIFTPEEFDDLAYSVVWCWWPPSQDDERFEEVQAFVEREASAALQRRSGV